MLKKFWRRLTNHFYITFFLSFVILIILSILVNSISGMYGRKMLSAECNDKNSERAIHFSMIIDEILRNFDSVGLGFENSADFVLTVSMDRKHEDLDRQRLATVRKLLTSSMTANHVDFFISYGNSDLILSGIYGTLSSRLYYQANYKTDQQSYAEWMALLDGSEESKVGIMYDKGKPCLAIARKLPVKQKLGTNIVVVSVLQPEILKNFMAGAQEKDGAIAIYTTDNRLLLSSNDDITSAIDLPENAPANQYLTLKKAGQSYFIYIVESESSKCRFVSFIPDYVLKASTNIWSRFQLAVNVLLFIAGLIFSYWMARIKARPVENTIQLISEKTSIDWNQNMQSDLEYLRTTIEQTLDEKQLIQQSFDMHHDVISQHFLYEIMNGKINEHSSLAEMFKRNHMPLISDCFSLILLQGPNNQPAASSVINALIRNAREMGALGYPLFLAQPYAICVLNLSSDFREEDLDELCMLIPPEMNYTVCRSDLITGLENLKNAFAQVKDLAELRVIYGSERIITSALLPENTAFSFNASFDTYAESELTKYIQDDGTACDEIFDKLCSAYSGEHAMTPTSARCFIYEMYRVISAVVTRQCSAAFSGELKLTSNLSSSDTIPQLRTNFIEIMECARRQYIEKHSDNVLCARVMDYLETNYRNPSLGVAALDSVFGVSSAYLSEQFKKHTGQSIGEYLTIIRMNHACLLLRETDDTLEEIAEKVGINGSSTLIRLFKKTQGITPGIYRKTYCVEQNI